MPLSDTARIAIVAETVPGTTPATPAFEILRLNSDSIVWEAERVPDPELNPARTLRDVIPTGGAVRGSIETGFAANTTFEAMLAGIFGADWGDLIADQLWPGTALKTFTIEKRIQDEGAASYSYLRFAGVTISSAQIQSAPDEPVTVSWGVVGGAFTHDTAEIAGATYADPSPVHALAPAFRGQDLVANFQAPPPGFASHCFTALTINLDSQNLATKCLGTEGEKDLHLGKFVVPIQATVSYKDTGILDKWIGQEVVSFDALFTDRTPTPNTHSYLFEFAESRIVQAGVPIPSTGELVVQELEIEAVDLSGFLLGGITRATV